MTEIALEAFQNRKSGDYLLQMYCGSTGTGKFIEIAAAEMQRAGKTIILNYLKSNPTNKVELPELAGFSREEVKAFHRRHRSVMLRLEEPEIIKIMPLRRKGSGFVAPKDQVIRISVLGKDEEFLSALNGAFESAD